ncbi:hypothetical protein COU54_03560 [Candidatus Pacearchaeota archaeon CG10_big_fil_rev_8_21_14_0_10_31_24]|nr:MAG: hypothetical protein COU54_03560 [Candidatus Pacearchaeota archaeon CG10_big_fil_rev_8_21_14_0_10_31_24]
MIKIGLGVFIFLIVGALLIISNNNLHLIKKDELDTFGRLYYSWISNIFHNIKTITGYVTLENWVPKNPVKLKNISISQ